MKVAQHVSNELCPDESKVPVTSRLCQAKESEGAIEQSLKPTEPKEEEKKEAKETVQKKIGILQTTGYAILDRITNKQLLTSVATIIIIILAIFGTKAVLRKKSKVSSEEYYEKAMKFHKKAQECHQKGHYDKAKELYNKAEEYRDIARNIK